MSCSGPILIHVLEASLGLIVRQVGVSDVCWVPRTVRDGLVGIT